MAADTPPEADVDQLVTEAAEDHGLMLDEMSVAELAELMNERDAGLAGAVRTQLPAITRAVEATVERMRRGGRLIYIGAGTSGRLGVLDASEIPPTFGTDAGVVVGLIAGGGAAVVNSAESAEDSAETGAADLAAANITAVDTVIGIAASGRTPYVLGAIAHATECGALTVGVSCNVGTPLSDAAEYAIEIPVGPEILAGSTRLGAGTATKMVLNMFSTIAMVHLGKTYGSLMVDVRAANAKLVRRVVRIVTLATGVDDHTARDALREADWHAKLAIAMIATGTDAATARAELDAAGGVLSRVISADTGPIREPGQEQP
ncbi:MAG: N-acetylmuramic acid 6-phosphate etherase [Gordonia sp. (in: high G+C Gram-positive bacteria)]